MPLLPSDVPSRQGIQNAINEVYIALDERINEMDTGWVALTLNTGWTGTAQYRVINNVVHLRGTVSRTSGSDTLIATLPTAIRPVQTMNLMVRTTATHANAGNFAVSSSGPMVISSAYSTGANVYLDSASPYPLG